MSKAVSFVIRFFYGPEDLQRLSEREFGVEINVGQGGSISHFFGIELLIENYRMILFKLE